jgi:hypothetical protein
MTDHPDRSNTVVKLVESARLELSESSRNNTGEGFKKPAQSTVGAQVQAVRNEMSSLEEYRFVN